MTELKTLKMGIRKLDKTFLQFNRGGFEMKTIDMIKQLEKEGYKITKESDGWLDIPELGISVEIEVHDKEKSWNDLKLDKREDELLTAEECIFLANSKYAKTLKMDGSSSKDDFYI